jgi:simple sugar transport system permease protein
MRSRINVRDAALSMAAPILAVAFATAVGSLILFVAGDPVGQTWQVMFDTAKQPRSIALIVNQGAVYYLSAIAVAIGFRMNLFNIGVDGQYRLAAFVAALTAAYIPAPGPVRIAAAILAAMVTGALWAGIAGLLRVTRGVSEVISTIMLNAIATSLVAYMLREVSVPIEGSNNIGTKPIPESARVPGIPLIPDSTQDVYGLVVVAVVAGIAYSVLLNRTRFGFDLRATGHSESAAQASGVNVKRMILTAMLISGAFAGLVGLPELLGQAYTYSLTFPAGLGFIGIAIALLGRNHPLGIAVGAALFSFLDVAANPLQIIADVSSEIVTIMQGIIVLAVVIAYEVIRRYRVTQEQRRVARQLEASTEAQGVPA